MTTPAVIVETLSEQAARGDTDLIDPMGVRAPMTVPVFRNFDHRFESILGHAENVRVEDGRVVADVGLTEVPARHWRYAVGGIVRNYTLDRRGVRHISELDLREISVVAR